MTFRASRLAAVAAAAIWACADAPTAPPGELELTIVRGDRQIVAAPEFLPEPLAVAVRRPDGSGVPGVVVTWRGAPAEAIEVIDSVTRADGTARARWALAATSETQRLEAAIGAGSSAIEFTARVRVAALEIHPRRLALWPGDTAGLSVAAFDARGARLAGEARIESRDPDVVRVLGDARLVARAVGRTAVWVTVGDRSVPLAARVAESSEAHLLEGTLRPLLPGSLPPLRVVATTAFGSFAAHSDTDGRFRVPMPDSLVADEPVRIDVDAGPETGLLPARLVVTPDALPLSLVLLPRQWRIDRGVFAGEVVDVSLDAAATATAPADYSFWFGRPTPGSLRFSLWTWAPDSLPARVAIVRRLSPDWQPEDSALVWQRLDQLEAYFGRDLFEPIPDDGYDRSHLPPRTVGVMVDRCCGFAEIFTAVQPPVQWDATVDLHRDATTIHASQGTLHRALVNLGSTTAATFIWHEMFHVLGAGHGCGWLSVQSNCDLKTPYGPTPEDVAYMELAWALRDEPGDSTRLRSLVAALIGERAEKRLPWSGPAEGPRGGPGARGPREDRTGAAEAAHVRFFTGEAAGARPAPPRR